jgi:hypothetical protein
MKYLAIATLLIFTFISDACLADQASKNLKLKQYMKFQGLYEVLEQQLKACETQAQATGTQMFAELRKQIPDMSPEMVKELDGAYQRFLANSKPNWTSEEAVALFAKNYGERVTEKELDQILVFWASPVGQKDAIANAQAIAQWTVFFNERNQPVLEKSISAFIAEVKEISSKNNSRNKK